MKTGLCTIAFSELPLEKVLDIAADVGFEGVEIWGKPPHIPDKYDQEYVKSIPKMTTERGLEIISFGSYVNPLMDNYKDHWDLAFKIAQDLGTKVMRVWSGGGSSKDITAENKQLIISRFREMAEKAESKGILLAMEMHGNNFTDTAETILELLNAVDHPNLKTYYQPVSVTGASSPYEAARLLGQHVIHVHAQNSGSDELSGEIGDGILDYKRIVEILKSEGFDGCLEVEFVRGQDKMASLRRDRDTLAEIITKV